MLRDIPERLETARLRSDLVDGQSRYSNGIPYMENTVFSKFTPDEQAYAISQLDPFHDQAYKLNGAPSDQSADSVVITVNQEIVVDASDFGLSTASGDKWDLHVAALPISKNLRAYGVYQYQSNGFSAGTSTGSESLFKELFPVSLSANNSGDPTFVCDSASIPILGLSSTITSFTSNQTVGIATPRCLRIIAISFEIVDESPTLYQQGACTVYSRSSSPTPDRLFSFTLTRTGGTTNASYELYTDSFGAPPTRIQQATILPNSKTWKASEGAYVISRKTVDTVPFTRPGAANLLMYNPTDPDNSNSRNSFVGREAINLTSQPSNVAFLDAFCNVTPYNVSGAYLTGLNSEFGTYRIRSKVSYEIIPDPTDTSLVPQATPTLPRNPEFERLLDETIHRLPPGVPQSQNPAGEWWRTVKKVARAVGAIAHVASVPIGAIYGPAAGHAVGLTGAAISDIIGGDAARRQKEVKKDERKRKQALISNRKGR